MLSDAQNPEKSIRYVPITGMYYEYRIGDMGDVQKKLPNGKWKTLVPFMSKKHKRAYVHMRDASGKPKAMPVNRLMDTAFFGGRAQREGLCITYKNSSRYDCSVHNLKLITKEELLRNNGGACKRVAKLDEEGNIIEIFPSCQEAAEREWVSKCAIYNRVHNLVKNPFTLTGYNYQFLEDIDE